MNSDTGRLFLVPLPLGSLDTATALPASSIEVVAALRRFIAEDIRTARRFLTQLPLKTPIQQIAFETLNEHTQASALDVLLAPLLAGEDVGLVSEAGCPGVADPGANLIARAHDNGILVVPLVGPSAILLALMASGMNGQRFRFNGYLPVDAQARATAIKTLEEASRKWDQSEIFIETPYRGDALLGALIDHCASETRLAVAIDLTLRSEQIISRPVSLWRTQPRPQLAKRPAVFVLQAAPRQMSLRPPHGDQ